MDRPPRSMPAAGSWCRARRGRCLRKQFWTNPVNHVLIVTAARERGRPPRRLDQRLLHHVLNIFETRDTAPREVDEVLAVLFDSALKLGVVHKG